jgi:dTMP kinase
VGRLVVLEGLDGSGKATLTAALAKAWTASGRRVGTLAFPRYGVGVHADLVRDALYGRLGDLAESVYGPAVLFALDRFEAAPLIRSMLADHDVVLLDRYVSSNAAYGSARLGGPETPTDFAEVVRRLEMDRFRLPVPDLQILLDVPAALAQERAVSRAGQLADRALDTFEADRALQYRTAAMYRELAAAGYLSPWRVLQPAADGELSIPDDLLD